MGELVAPRRAARSPRSAEAASRLVGGAGWLLVAVAAWLAVYPSVVLLASSLVAGGRVGLDHYARALSDPGVHQAFGNSLVVSTAAAAAGTALGVLLAWLTTRTDLPGAGAWHAALLLPYMIPPFIGAIAWVYLLGPVGYLNRLWMWLSGSMDPLLVVYGPGGIVFALALYGYPVPYLVVRGALERMNPALDEAARMSGAGPCRCCGTWWRRWCCPRWRRARCSCGCRPWRTSGSPRCSASRPGTSCCPRASTAPC